MSTENIEKKNHWKALEALRDKVQTEVKESGNWEGAEIWFALSVHESRAHTLAEQYCNGVIPDAEDVLDNRFDRFKEAVERTLGGKVPGLFINRDPRGYALKIDPERGEIPEGLVKDWGGYGILAPSFD